MTDFNIQYGRSTEIFIDGKLNPNLIIEEGCWYLCIDTAELFIGVTTETGLTLKRINEAIINQIPIENLALKSDLESTKQEVIQTVVPTVNEVKTKVNKDIAPTVDELKAWVENKEYLQEIDLEGYVTNEKVTEIITEEVSTVVDKQVETKVVEVIQEKVDTGEVTVSTNAITYGDF